MTPRRKLNLAVVAIVGVGVPAYYKVKHHLAGRLRIDELSAWSTLLDVTMAAMLGGIVIVVNDGVVRWLRRPNRPPSRGWTSVLTQFAATTVCSALAAVSFTHAFCGVVLHTVPPPDVVLDMVVVAVFIPLAINGIVESHSYYGEWRQTCLEKEVLHREFVGAKFDALKSQISPHFLFNSLNTLAELIEESPAAASAFVEELATVYRYVLENKDLEVVELSKELRVLRSYAYLLEMRFGNNVRIDIDVASDRQDNGVAPLTLQILLENALKHNIATRERPLQVSVRLDDRGQLVVHNNLQRRSSAPSTSTGLLNIQHRYESLCGRAVQVVETATEFTVIVPTLKKRAS